MIIDVESVFLFKICIYFVVTFFALTESLFLMQIKKYRGFVFGVKMKVFGL